MSTPKLRARWDRAAERTTLLARYGRLDLAGYRAVPAHLAAGNPRVAWGALATAGAVPLASIAGQRGSFWTLDLARAAWAANPQAASLNPDLPWDRLFDEVARPGVPWGRLAANPGIPWTEARIRHHLAFLIDDDADWHPDMALEAPRFLNPSVRQSATPLEHLAQNPGLPWSEGLGAGIPWDWGWLSRNPGLPWSPGLVQRYLAQWDWAGLSSNPAVPFAADWVRGVETRVDWVALSHNPGSFWSTALLQAWRPRLAPVGLAQNPALPWDEALILEVGASVRVRLLENNPGIRWTAAAVSALGADLGRISDRSGWTVEALRALAARLPWRSVSASRCLPWSAALVHEFSSRWDWELLSANPSLPWTAALLEAHAEAWSLAGLARNDVAGPMVADLLA